MIHIITNMLAIHIITNLLMIHIITNMLIIHIITNMSTLLQLRVSTSTYAAADGLNGAGSLLVDLPSANTTEANTA